MLFLLLIVIFNVSGSLFWLPIQLEWWRLLSPPSQLISSNGSQYFLTFFGFKFFFAESNYIYEHVSRRGLHHARHYLLIACYSLPVGCFYVGYIWMTMKQVSGPNCTSSLNFYPHYPHFHCSHLFATPCSPISNFISATSRRYFHSVPMCLGS